MIKTEHTIKFEILKKEELQESHGLNMKYLAHIRLGDYWASRKMERFQSTEIMN